MTDKPETKQLPVTIEIRQAPAEKPMSDKLDPKKPQNQTQDTSTMIGTAKPPPPPLGDAEPIDPNHPEWPRRPRIIPPAEPEVKDDSGN